MSYLPNKNELLEFSILSKFNLNKSLSKINKEDLFKDILRVLKELNRKSDNIKYVNRIKSINSCKIKYDKNLKKGNKIKSTFNDILGIRIIVENYEKEYPDYFRVVDMSKGKKNDDGYRGIHLYFQVDNFHYPIEIQLNTNKDRLFADLSHKYTYKYKNNELSLHLRKLFDSSIINNEFEFIKEMKKYEESNCS